MELSWNDLHFIECIRHSSQDNLARKVRILKLIKVIKGLITARLTQEVIIITKMFLEFSKCPLHCFAQLFVKGFAKLNDGRLSSFACFETFLQRNCVQHAQRLHAQEVPDHTCKMQNEK